MNAIGDLYFVFPPTPVLTTSGIK